MNGYVRETHNWNTFELSWYDMTCRKKYCTSCILLFLNENKYFEFMKCLIISKKINKTIFNVLGTIVCTYMFFYFTTTKTSFSAFYGAEKH